MCNTLTLCWNPIHQFHSDDDNVENVTCHIYTVIHKLKCISPLRVNQYIFWTISLKFSIPIEYRIYLMCFK